MGRRRGRSGRRGGPGGRRATYGGQAKAASSSQVGADGHGSPRAPYPAASKPRESVLGIEPSFHNPEASSNFLPHIQSTKPRQGGGNLSSPEKSLSSAKLPYLKQNIQAVKLKSQGGLDRVGVLMKQGVMLPIQRLGDMDEESAKKERKPRHLSGVGLHAHMSSKQLMKGMDAYYSCKDMQRTIANEIGHGAPPAPPPEPRLMRDVNYYMGFYRDMASEYRDWRASIGPQGAVAGGAGGSWQADTPDINYLAALGDGNSSEEESVSRRPRARNATLAEDWASRPKQFTEEMRHPVPLQRSAPYSDGEPYISGNEGEGGDGEGADRGGADASKPLPAKAPSLLAKPPPQMHRVLSQPRVKAVQPRGGASLWVMDEEAEMIGVPIAMQPFMLRQFKGVSQALLDEALGAQQLHHRARQLAKKARAEAGGAGGSTPPVLGQNVFGFEANGLEELLLAEALAAAPAGAGTGVEERLLDIIDADSMDKNLVNGSLCAMLSSTKAVVQVCRQVSFVQVDAEGDMDVSGYCLALNLINSRLAPHDVTTILYVLEMDGKQVANAVAEYNSQCPRGIDRMKTTDVLEQLIPTPKHHSNAAVPLNAREQVQSMTGLTLLPLHHKSAVAAMHFSSSCTAITHLLLSSTALTDGSVAAMALCLRDMPWVQVLDLSDNQPLTWRCCAPLAELLRSPSTAAEATGYPKHSVTGCGANRLQKLLLNGVAVGDKGFEMLSRALMLNQHLRLLGLQRAGLTASAAADLGRMLEENLALRDLRLGWNSLQASGGEVVADALRSNASLLHLDVANNGLTDSGGSHFALALQGNAGLKSLDLSNNGIGSSSCLVLSESLKHNVSLTTLALNGNPLGAEGGMYLLNTLADEGSSLAKLGLQGASFMQRVDVEGRQQMMYNRANPSGAYVLDLSRPADRQIATELARLHEQQGADCWRDATLDGRPVPGPRPEDGWGRGGPPKQGELRLTFVASMAPPENAQSMLPRDFNNICTEMRHPSADDLWRLSMLHVLCGTSYFTAAQARELAETFQWRGELLQACLLLFMRVTDAHNLDQLTGCLRKEEERRLLSVLGMVAFFRPEHPSGHYSLNLSRQMDRVVAMRLLMQARKEAPHWQRSPALRNFRNTVHNGKPLTVEDAITFNVPHEGTLVTDFISYDFGTVMSTIKRPPAFRRHFVACSPLDFARLVAAVKTLQTWADEREAAAAASSDDDDSDNDGEGSSPFKSRAASAKSTRAPSAKAPESQEATPRSLREAAGEVMVNFRKKSNPLAFDGATLTAMLCQVEQWRETQDKQPKRQKSTVDGREFKRMITRVNAQAGRMATQRRGKVSDAMRQGMHAKMSRATEKISALNVAWKGMADIFDDSVGQVDPVAVVRMFAAKEYCSCSQLVQLLEHFDSANEQHSALRVDIVQLLFTRTVDLAHFSDVLRQLSPLEQVQTMRRCGFHNAVYLKGRHHLHLHGVHFALRLSREEELRVCRTLAEYVPALPNPAAAGSSAPASMFSNLHINGSPASISEDAMFWKTLSTVAKDRRRPDATWDPAGTVEFQLRFPPGVRREAAALHIQRVWRGSRWRRQNPKLVTLSEYLRSLSGSEVGRKVTLMLAAMSRNSSMGSGRSTPNA